ncbi:MAG: (Fe-S) protein, partial [Pseudomonadales bacterium]|nr:(Fe-S) protein [Pseudomonadales bacterium]
MDSRCDDDLTPIADCRMCQYRRTLLLSGRCSPGDSCVVVDSGRQIDRFFRINPELAPLYTQDKFWERRAIAARYLPVEKL